MKTGRYSKEICVKMYRYFRDYSGEGAPSFSKFARDNSLTLERLESYRSHSEFQRIYRECQALRRDYIIDKALSRKADGNFSKFLLGEEMQGGGQEKIDLTITVVE